MTDKRITYMHSEQLGAPQMLGTTPNAMLLMLDAVLGETAYNENTVLSATKTAVSVTLTYSGNHGYLDKQLVTISGADDIAMNGRHRVIDKTSTTITIDAKGVSALTGTISTSVSGLNFENIFGSDADNKRAYRSKNPLSTQSVLYLDMSYPLASGYTASKPVRAMVSICEDMEVLGVQINSHTDAVNNYATNPNGTLFWYQIRGDTKTTNVPTSQIKSRWVVVGNGDYFYLLNAWTNASIRATGTSRDLYMFGDVESFAGSSDTNNCVWCGAVAEDDVATIYTAFNGAMIGGDPKTSSLSGYFIGGAAGENAMTRFSISYGINNDIIYSGMDSNSTPYPSVVTNSLLTIPLVANTEYGWRAEIPSLLAIPQNLHTDTTLITALDLVVSSNILTVGVQQRNGNLRNCMVAFDISAGG